VNRSGTDVTALIAHSAGDDQQAIVLLPELDGVIP
jgi:hypothetical protein